MLPSRCFRCGAVSRDALCPSCVDYLVAYHPLWLDPGLLPGPSLLDLLGPRETAMLSVDGDRLEWRSASRERPTTDTVRLIELLRLDEPHPIMSVGDAEVLHAFLGQGRRGTPADAAQRGALAALYRYLSSRDWMPPHLAEEYRLRARSLVPEPVPAEGPSVSVAREEGLALEEGLPPPAAEVPPEATTAAEASPPAKPTEETVPEEILRTLEDLEEPEVQESPLPAPEPETPPPPLSPPPSPPAIPPELLADAVEKAAREAVERERKSVEAWVEARTHEIATKEETLAEREKSLEARLLAAEKDEARREVLRFLANVPGMRESDAQVVATAFPDMASLRAADARALSQCRGVTDSLARTIRFELVPGEVEDEQRAIDLREQAQNFLEEGDYRAALDCYSRLVAERPEDVGLWFDQAEVHVLLDQPEDALQCYQRVIALDHRNRQAWFERANLLFGLGHLADALDALREALKIEPAKSGDIALKAEQLRRDGHGNEAAILYQAILDVDPENLRATLGLGDAFLDLGDLDAAEALLTRALGKGGGDPQVLFRKGELLRRKGRWGAAIQFFNRAVALQWDYPDPWMAKGEILLEHDRAQEAIECFDRVLAVDPTHVAAWARKAMAHRVIHQFAEADRALEEAVALGPDDPAVTAAKTAAGRTTAEGRPRPHDASPAATEEPSVAELVKSSAELPSMEEPDVSPSAPSVSEEETSSSGERATSPSLAPAPADLRGFVDSVEPEKEETHVLLELAELALEGGDADMALLRYEQALVKDPRSAAAWVGKGTALQQLERYDEALDAYDRALEIHPGDELAARWRETCLRHLKQEGRG